MFNGFKDKDAPPMNFSELLPFPEEIKAQNSKVSDRTKAIIAKAIKDNSLPSPVLATLSMLVVD